MTDEYKDYLASRVISESKPVTYRLLSRELKVNVNVAKQMLYEFHTKQNSKRPKSVHATYLLTGRKRNIEYTNGINGRDGKDTFMHSSPYMSSMPEPEEPVEEPVPKDSIVLVKEEDFEATKAEFEEITSVHIYSLEPGSIENLNLLSICNSEITTQYSNEDPLARWRLYGSLHNPYIKRRTSKFAPASAAVAPKPSAKATTKAVPVETSKAKENAAPARRGSASGDNILGQSTPQPPSGGATLKKSDSKPNLKREKSDIFKSFAKAKPKPKEAEKSKESTPAPAEDEPMQGMSEDEGDDDDGPEVKFDEEKAAEARKARAEREEKLRKMMEDDDEDMPDAPEEEKDPQDAPSDKAPTTMPADSEATVTVQGGRRRGRRKVMKKRTVKDEEGYLVTKEEAVWESFSEDEPQPKKPKPAPKPVNTAKGKNAAKKGQGSIANFFKKA